MTNISSTGRDLTDFDIVESIIASDSVKALQLDFCCHLIKDKRKKKRKRRARIVNLWQDSPWGLILRQLPDEESNSYLSRKFRRRFRLPYTEFISFVEEIRPLKIFNKKRQSRIPLEFKILISLRVLGRDWCADDISEFTGIGESTVNSIFHTFVHGCSDLLFDKYIHPPTGERLAEVKKVYEYMGFPGAVGSMDCTHVRWDQCPKHLQNICSGKAKKPTICFHMIRMLLSMILIL
jgi:hypothetical protein